MQTSVLETMKSRHKPKTLQTTSPTINSNFLSSESNYMPPEIWTKVFAILPAKTLLQFRCVCKSWCSIIDDPDFVPMHLKHNSVNSDKNKLIFILERTAKKGDNNCSLTVRQVQANTLRIISQIFRKGEVPGPYFISGSCNGLLLVRGDYPHYQSRLWNPCIRKSLILPTPPLPPNLITGAKYIFGFAPDSNEYKVVAIVFERNPVEESANKINKMHVAVYTLGDQQWTVRNDWLNVELSYFASFLVDRYDNIFKSNAIYFRGEAHWLVKDYYEISKVHRSTYLVSFNFDTEKFTFAELPFASYERQSSSVLFLLGESLAIFSISALSSRVRVLEKGEWTLWFSGFSSKNGVRLFSCTPSYDFSPKNVLFLLPKRKRKNIRFDISHCESERLFTKGYLIYRKNSYNIATCQVHKLTESESKYFALEMYSESLVLHKGYGAQDLI